jgi:uncharacterized membrane protein
MTKVKFIDLFAFILCIIPFVTWFMLSDSLPEKLPIHWNARGEVNGWTTKQQVPIFLLSLTAIGAITYILLRFIRRIDPKRNAQLNETITLKVGIGIITFITAINLLLLMPKGDTFKMTTVVFVMVSLLFTFLGNLMYNIKPNYFIGVRLPWTLENDDNWKHTHRLAGITWFIGGIVSAILSLLLPQQTMFPVFIGITIILVLIPSIYSYMLFKRSKNQSQHS